MGIEAASFCAESRDSSPSVTIPGRIVLTAIFHRPSSLVRFFVKWASRVVAKISHLADCRDFCSGAGIHRWHHCLGHGHGPLLPVPSPFILGAGIELMDKGSHLVATRARCLRWTAAAPTIVPEYRRSGDVTPGTLRPTRWCRVKAGGEKIQGRWNNGAIIAARFSVSASL